MSDIGPPPGEAQFRHPTAMAPNLTVEDPRLGRVPQFDPASRSFSMRAALDEKRYKPRSYTWSVAAHLDQGWDPSCVGCAWTHELIARPAVTEGLDYPFAKWVYQTAQRFDPWAGESYAGTSVLAGAKVLHKKPPEMPEGRGLIGEYRWIFGSIAELEKTLGYFGPVVLGINWHEGMFKPDEHGIIHPTGPVAGGHAILATGVDVRDRIIRLHNSWGEGWGKGGDAFIGYDDLEALLAAQGEACVPMRRMRLEES